MTRYLTIDEVDDLHRYAIQSSGGSDGVHSKAGIEAAVAAPQAGFGGVEFYVSVSEKAAVLGYSLIQNHGYIDGNKRTGFFAMATFAELNGASVTCTADEGEQVVLAVASGDMSRDEFIAWAETAIATSGSIASD